MANNSCALTLSYYDIVSKKVIPFQKFAPFHEAYFDGIVVPVSGDVLYSSDNKKYELIRREFMMENSKAVKTILFLKEIIEEEFL